MPTADEDGLMKDKNKAMSIEFFSREYDKNPL